MGWFQVLTVLIIVNSVELKCGEFSNNKTLKELPAVIMDTKIGEIVTIPLPKIHKNELTFILTKPNGEQYSLSNLNYNNNGTCNLNTHLNSITNDRNKCVKSLKTNDKENEDKNNKEITVGPIKEDHFGNWAISACYDENDTEVEVFQLFSLHIEEHITTIPKKATMHQHEDLKIRLIRPITDLKTCELAAPKGSPDRAFERDPEFMDSCGFILKDARVADAGPWRVIAVGNIVYVGEMNVTILEP